MATQITIEAALTKAVTSTNNPGAVAYVGNMDQTFFHGAVGYRQLIPEKEPATKDTIYDLASLTKVVATTTIILRLYDDGVIDLDQPYTDIVPIPAFRGITIRQLLNHTAGLAPYFAYYKQHTSMLEMIDHFAQTAVKNPPGIHRQYSDVGFMLLGFLAEMAAEQPLDDAAKRLIFEPARMNRTAYNPPESWKAQCAATERCPWRGYVIRGVVHDENAFAVGGVSGHAGLFSTAEDLARFSRALLGGKLISETTLAEATRVGQLPRYPWQGLGWNLDPWLSGLQGALPSRKAFGHTGWTGTSMWLDRESGFFAILLGNTCHPSRQSRRHRQFRQTFHFAIAEKFYDHRRNVHTGLDRLVWDHFDKTRNKRIGLLTNSAAVDQLGRPILDVFSLNPATNVHIVYSPEHGFARQAEAGEKVGAQAAAQNLVSLYGDREAPSPNELAEINLFVIDLQDIGARYYTYMHTMKNCLEACAKAGTPVLVLDRPNPLGGLVVEGPMPENTDSPVCSANIPVRHAMTMGELATYFARNIPNLKLDVSLLDNWSPALYYDDCSLPWTPPSPNIPTPDTALVYIGTCLFEGTNLNEGRGTETPFHIIGAPWLDADAVISAVPQAALRGCSLEAEQYTPVSIPGKATSPRYQDQPCNGIRIRITNREFFRPFTTAVALLSAIHKTHGADFEMTNFFDTLAGSPNLRTEIRRGDDSMDIIAHHNSESDQFSKSRPRFYKQSLIQG